MNQIFREDAYKSVTIDWLLKKGYLKKDAVLINELPVSNFSRRADLVVANGKLHAFEIKSDVDSISRLEGQIETYLEYFDKVTLICSGKFTQKAIHLLPREVEIIEFNATAGKPRLTIKRRGKIIPIESPEHYLSFVDKKHLLKAAKQKHLACHAGENRQMLYQKLSTQPKTYWRSVALDYLKKKYEITYQAFLKSRTHRTQENDLKNLSLNKLLLKGQGPKDLEKESPWDDNVSKHDILVNGVDVSERMAHMGIITSRPVYVIPRRLK